MLNDLTEEDLRSHRFAQTMPSDFDVRFPGWGGQPIAAWLRRPAGVAGSLPAVVQFVGCGGARGLSTENLLWASTGFAHRGGLADLVHERDREPGGHLEPGAVDGVQERRA